MKNSFKEVAANPTNPKWEHMILRDIPLYARNNDIRTDFERDYTRILHCRAYRRLKHKTQVFFSPENDHICTRIEHVSHVESISYTIANYLGLNTELTKAIAIAHDIGHSPFGHEGEKVISQISKKDLGINFWHEKNGLDFVDYFELLEDDKKCKQNLDLTYAVRDGIISHCGEVDENAIRPREDFIDLNEYDKPNKFAPYTWEACVVKISDKISYICRDIEDAITLGILDEHLNELYDLLKCNSSQKINNTVIINNLVFDLCENSSPEKGLCFSEKSLKLINDIKEYNYKNIYFCKRIQPSARYFNLIINEIYNALNSTFDESHSLNTMNNLHSLIKFYPKLINAFNNWLLQYSNLPNRNNLEFKNKIVFDINNKQDFQKSILYFISGMTDNFAIEIYNEIVGFLI